MASTSRPASSPGLPKTDVRVTGIRKGFADTEALSGIDLHVREGELLALLGPSGSGKTTLLRVIAGLEIPDEGRVLFGGDDVTDRPVQERRVGFVFQHYALFRHLTVSDNVAYGLRARGRSRPPAAEIAARVGRLLDLVQLGGLERRFPAQLSGGQRQRVALARALAVEPRVLLLDEPFGALDAQVRKDLRRWLKELHAETGQTTIFVTHDQDEALELADRVAILNGGLLEQVASPDSVYDAPESPFVMSFVGESCRVRIRIADGRPMLGEVALSLALPLDLGDGEADLFLRPAHVTLADRNAPGALPATVGGVRRIGGTRRADVRLVNGGADLEADLRDEVVRPGDAVGVVIRGGHVFRAPPDGAALPRRSSYPVR